VNAEQVDGAFFDVLGVAPLRGRLITTADDASAAPVARQTSVATITRRHFNGDPSLRAG